MKDKQARALAIVALVFMGIFLVAFTATLIDRTLLGGAVGFIALGTFVFIMVIFLALKADGRGFSITKMNNEAEMNKILEDIEKQKAGAETEENAEPADGETPPEADNAETTDIKTE